MPRFLASLRYRFFLALGTTLLMALAALALIAKLLVLPALLKDERLYASQELDRIQRAIDNELGHLSLLNKDWAVWDDSYAFLRGRYPDYPSSNLTNGQLFDDANLRLVVFLDTAYRPYRVAGIDPDTGDYTICTAPTGACRWAAPLVASMQRHVARERAHTRHTWLHAWPTLSMVSAWPVLKSDGSGPPAGWLAMARGMNATWLVRLKASTGIAFTATPASDAADADPPLLVRRSDDDMLATRRLAASPAGHAIQLQAALPRDDFQTSLGTFRFALYWTLALIVLVVLVVLLLLEMIVLKPLRQLARLTDRVRFEEDTRVPAPLTRRQDEIGRLAQAFNHLLAFQRRRTHSLVQLSQHDPLTGLANRRLFDKRLTRALDDARHHAQPVAMLMIDIDHFKAYNDHYGHPAGDVCLKRVAQAMQASLAAPGYLLARTGGEEFSVLMPDTGPAAAREQAETVRAAVEALGIEHGTAPQGDVVTISVGLAVSTRLDTPTPGALGAAADAALYTAKKAGRNRIAAGPVPA